MLTLKVEWVNAPVRCKYKPMVERKYADALIDQADGSLTTLKAAYDEACRQQQPGSAFSKWDAIATHNATGGLMASERRNAIFRIEWVK